MIKEEQEVEEDIQATRRLDLYHIRLPRPGAPKLLLLGGSNFDIRLKRAFLHGPIADNFEIATYEPRGIGRSAQPDGDWNMQDYALDALGFMDSLGWQDALVLGESFGGMTALHLAHHAPDRVKAMVIASATGGGPEHASYDISTFLDVSREQAAFESLCLQDTRNRTLSEADPERFIQILKSRIAFEEKFVNPSIASGGYARLLDARRRHDCTGFLSDIATPTTIIAGRYDKQARPEAQKALAEALPNAHYQLLDGGHGLLFNCANASQAALSALLQSVETR